MPSVLDDFEELKRKVARLAEKEARMKGEATVLARQLKAEFGVSLVKDGRVVEKKLYAEKMATAKAYLDGKKKFEEENRAELEKLDE